MDAPSCPRRPELSATRLRQYFALVDGGDDEGALGLVSDDVQFAFVSPAGVIEEGGRTALADYLGRRSSRVHRVSTGHTAGDTDVVFGESVEPDGTVVAPFVAMMTFGSDGLAMRYHAAIFHRGIPAAHLAAGPTPIGGD